MPMATSPALNRDDHIAGAQNLELHSLPFAVSVNLERGGNIIAQ